MREITGCGLEGFRPLEEVHFLVWLLYHNALTTNDVKVRRKLFLEARCKRCLDVMPLLPMMSKILEC